MIFIGAALSEDQRRTLQKAGESETQATEWEVTSYTVGEDLRFNLYRRSWDPALPGPRPTGLTFEQALARIGGKSV